MLLIEETPGWLGQLLLIATEGKTKILIYSFEQKYNEKIHWKQ